jgi:NAD(P)H-dependent flavin oxidoreductase YrpB (nitropropane dioxygenase family)
MRLLSAVAAVAAAVAVVAVGVMDGRRTEVPAGPVSPRVVFTLPTCDGLPAFVNVTNPAGNRAHLRVGFNDDLASPVEPGGSVGFELTAGEVQVLVDDRPYGGPYRYLPPSCLQLP